MWEALIKLVEKWSYRCEHDWESLAKTNIYLDGDKDKLPIKITRTYRCTKCCEFKRLDT